MRRTIHVTVLTVSIIMLTSCSEAPAPEPQAEVEKAVPEVPAKLDLPNLSPERKAAADELLRRASKCTWRQGEFHTDVDCGDGETADLLLERAIELDPTLASAYELLARYSFWVNYDQGSMAKRKAGEVCQRMVDALPADARSHLCLYGYTENWKIDEKESLVRKAVKLDPEHAGARFALARLLYKDKFERRSRAMRRTVEADRELDEAIAHYREGLKLEPVRGVDIGEGRGVLFESTIFLQDIMASRQRISAASDLLIVIIDGSGGGLRVKNWCDRLSGFMSRKPYQGSDSILRDHPDFQPAVAKFREHCENPDLERAVALAKEARTEDRIDEAIVAWEPLFDTEAFAQDAYLSLFRLYRKGRFTQKWSWFDWKGYDGKARALVVKYFEREHDGRNRCEAVRETNFRELLPELYDELQQECAAPVN